MDRWVAGASLALAVLIAPAALRGEGFELTPHVGGLMSGAVSTRQGDLEIDPGAAVGLTAGWWVRHDGLIELTYTRQETALDLDSRPLFDLTLDYLHAGGAWEIRTGPVRPFIGLALGAARLDPDLGEVDSEWLFSAAMYGGVKRYWSERLGVRFEGRGLLHGTGSGNEVFCGFSGGGASGCAASLEGDGFLQLQASLGLIVRF